MELLIPESANPRLDYIDPVHAEGVLHTRLDYLPHLQALLRDTDSPQFQIRLNSYARQQHSIAMLSYALGYPLAYVRECLGEALKAYRKVILIRGSFPSLPRTEVATTVRVSQVSHCEITSLDASDSSSLDLSLGNSSIALESVYLSAILGDIDHCREIASHIWDPEDAPYVGLGKFACIEPDQQALAYAMRSYFHGDLIQCSDFLDSIKCLGPRGGYWTSIKSLIAALRDGSDVTFLDALKRLLEAHSYLARLPGNRYDTSLYFCSSGLGVCAMAVSASIIDIGHIPEDVFLPLKLTSASVPGSKKLGS